MRTWIGLRRIAPMHGGPTVRAIVHVRGATLLPRELDQHRHEAVISIAVHRWRESHHGDLHAALGFHPLAPFVLALNFGLMIPIVFGRSDMLLRGRRVYVVLAVIAAIWVLRFVL